MKALNQSEKALLRLWINQNQPVSIRKIDTSFAFLCGSIAMVLSMPIVFIIANGGSVHL